MGFFDSIVNAADNLGAKVSGNVDAMSINSQVSSKEKEMNNLYAQLGMAYYSIHKSDPDDACRNLVQLLINKEAELNKLKGDLAAKKAETAAIGQPNYAQQGMYQQPMGQPMNQGMGQPMMGQPMNQGMGQPMNQGMNTPMQPIVVPIKQDEAPEDKKEDKAENASETDKAEDVEKKEEAETASEPEKTAESEGKTCSICGATGQSGAFCGNCGSKLE